MLKVTVKSVTGISVLDNYFRVTYKNPESDVSTLFLCSLSNSM